MTLILSGTDNSVSSPAVQGGTAGTTTGVYYPATNQLALATNGTQAVLVDSSQNVGIGTSSPAQKLQVLAVNSTGFAGAAIQNQNTNVGIAGVQFSSDTTYFKSAIGQVRSDSNGVGSLVFYNASSTGAANWSTSDERMRIDSSGNVGIGTTSPTRLLDVTTTGVLAAIAVVQNTSTASAQLRVKNPQNETIFGVDTASGGLTGTGSATYLYGGNSYPMIFYTNATERMRINAGAPILCLNGGNTSATGTGIAFPATQSASSDANTLDDYEEGTWTPAFSAAGYTFSYGSQNGYYTKIGSVVLFKLYLTVSVASGSGGAGASITGLPYTSSNISPNYGGVSVNPDTGSAYLTTGGYTMTARTAPNSTSIVFYVGNGGNSLKGAIAWSGMTASTEFEISGHYFTT